MSYRDGHPCRHCDRTTEEVAACPSAHATACSSHSFNVMLGGIQRVQKKLAATGNYVANDAVDATRVLFANGRTVRIVNGRLVVGWARKEAERVFASPSGERSP
jgi:hypothetical protein